MRLSNIQAIVLAAGKSTRLNTGTTKHIEKICGQEMILYQTKLLESMGIPTTVVVGYQKERIQETIVHHHADRVHFVTQQEQCGTGNAIVCAEESWKEHNILIMNGNVPLVTDDIITSLYTKHTQTNAAITMAIAHNADPSGQKYRRVIKQQNEVTVVPSEQLNEEEQHEYCWVDGSIYIISKTFLENNKTTIACRTNRTAELCISEVINLANQQQQTITTVSVPFDKIRGINTYEELWAAEQVKRSELIRCWMNKGVRFGVAQSVHIDLNVSIGSGTFVGCGAHITKGSSIGKNCIIDSFSSVENSVIEDHVTIHSHSLIKDSHVAHHAQVGPFAHVQEKTTVHPYAHVGNFVEVKRSTIGAHSKAKHLTYLGDAQVGEKVNVGAGTITCNYDGTNKHTTTIEDNVFVGSNNTLVAPLTLGKNCYTAAGSTITHDVPSNALAFGRARQVTKNDYVGTVKSATEQKKPTKKASSFLGALKTTNDMTPTEQI